MVGIAKPPRFLGLCRLVPVPVVLLDVPLPVRGRDVLSLSSLQVHLLLHRPPVEPAGTVRASLSLVHGMLPDDFHVEIAPNRSKLFQQLRNRCAPPDKENLEIWNNAWDRFSIESFYQIPVPSCFPYHRSDSRDKRGNYTLIYKREAVRRLLPKFKERIEFLTGKAERNVAAIISMLESWQSELPAGVDLAPPFRKRPVKLRKPEPPAKILLPLPPTRFKKRKVKVPKTRRHPGQRVESLEAFAGRASGKLLPPSSLQLPDAAHLGDVSSDEEMPSEFDL